SRPRHCGGIRGHHLRRGGCQSFFTARRRQTENPYPRRADRPRDDVGRSGFDSRGHEPQNAGNQAARIPGRSCEKRRAHAGRGTSMRRRRRAPHANHERWLVSYADFITLLFAFFVVLYSSSQVDKRKVGKLAVAIQVAFQELGVFPASSTAIPVESQEPVPFNTVQAIENAERTAELGKIVPKSKGALGTSENGDLSSLRQELEDALAPEIRKNEVAVTIGRDGLVVSLREVGFFESGSANVRASSQSAFNRIAWLLAE